jgi:chromosome segregation ATPase
MKNYLCFFGSLLVFGALNAQKPIEVTGTNFKLGQDEYPGLQLIIPEAGFERVETMWIKALEKGTKSDVVDGIRGEFTIFGAYIKSISEEPVNVYSQIIPHDSTVELNATVEIKRSEFITENSYESEYNQLKTYLRDFGKEVYTEVVSDQVKAEEDVLNELEKELRQHQNDQEKMEKQISKEEHHIDVSEDDIRTLESDLVLKNEEIAQAKVQLNSAADDPVQKATLKDALKGLEKDRKKILRSIKKEKKHIVGNESTIDNTQVEIPSLVEQQNQKMLEIENQRNRVALFKKKLDTVKSY